jgi:hypothetical protein
MPSKQISPYPNGIARKKLNTDKAGNYAGILLDLK